MSNLPTPTIDHVVINVRDRLDEAQALYRRLGFHLTPRGYHTLGSINHLAIFGTDYLELIAVPPGKTDRNDILQFPEGLNGLVFGSDDADATFARLTEAGVPILPPNSFSRPVEFADGVKDAAFRTTRIAGDAVPAGRLYFCQHFTRDLVWRDEWRQHPNGVVGVVRSTAVSADPQGLGALLARMFGQDSVQPIAGGCRLVLALSSFDIITPDQAARRYGDAMPDAGGRADYMACLTLRVKSLDTLSNVLAAGDIPAKRTDTGVIVPAAHTMGVTLEFVS